MPNISLHAAALHRMLPVDTNIMDTCTVQTFSKMISLYYLAKLTSIFDIQLFSRMLGKIKLN